MARQHRPGPAKGGDQFGSVGEAQDNHGSNRFFVEGFHPEKKDAQGTK